MGNVVPRRIAARDVRRCADQELIEKLVAGDRAALEEMHRRYSEVMWRTCARICRDDAEAADVFQDALVSALRALRAGARPRDLRAWLVATSRNQARDALRRRRFEPAALPAPPAADPAEEVLRREQLEDLMADLAQLTSAQRDALVLREFEGRSYDAIGATLSVSEDGARQRVTEARGALAALQRGRDMTCEDVQVRLLDGDGRTLAAREVRAHLDGCEACRAFAAAERRRRRRFAVLPLGGLAGAWRGRSGARGGGGAGGGRTGALDGGARRGGSAAHGGGAQGGGGGARGGRLRGRGRGRGLAWLGAGAAAGVAAVALIGGGPDRAPAREPGPVASVRTLGTTAGARIECRLNGEMHHPHVNRCARSGAGRAAGGPGAAARARNAAPGGGGGAPAGVAAPLGHAGGAAADGVPSAGGAPAVGVPLAGGVPAGGVPSASGAPASGDPIASGAPAGGGPSAGAAPPSGAAPAGGASATAAPTCEQTFRGVGYGALNDALAVPEGAVICPLDRAAPQLGLADRLNGALDGP